MCKKSKNSTRRVKQPNVEDLLQLFSPEINYIPLLTTFPTYYSLDKKQYRHDIYIFLDKIYLHENSTTTDRSKKN